MQISFKIPDCHWPYADEKAYYLALEVADYIGVNKVGNELVIIGDFADSYGLSGYDKHHSVGDLAVEYDRQIVIVNSKLDELEKQFKKSKKTYLEGNHEVRLKKVISKHIPALANRLSVYKEFNLDKRDFKFYPYGPNQAHRVFKSDLYVSHEPGSSGAINQVLNAMMVSLAYGHTHQRIDAEKTCKVTGKQIRALSCGWLGDKKHRVIFGYVPKLPNWGLAFNFTTHDGDFWDSQTVRISDDYTCHVYGKKFKG